MRNGGNVRAVAVTGAPLDQVNANETVQLLGKNNDATWYLLVTPRNVTGWVSASLLTVAPTAVAAVPVVPATSAGVPAAAASTAGWTTHSFGQYAVQLPPTWQTIPLTKEDMERAVESFGSANPALAQVMRQFIASGQFAQMQFFAVDTNSYGTNINAITQPRPAGIAPDQLLAQVIKVLPSAIPDIHIISADTKQRVGGLPAGRVVYDFPINDPSGQTITVRGVQWYIVGTSDIVILTITGVDDDELTAVAEQIGRSFTTQNATGSTASAGTRRQVIHGGNLRRAPQVSTANVIGQVCPGDLVELQDVPARAGWAALLVVETANDCDPKRVPAGAEGWVSTTLLGPAPADATTAPQASMPPSLPISVLVPFTHDETKISGLRPENWTIFSNPIGFQISSSPEAPDGFIGKLIAPEEYPAGGAKGASKEALAAFKQNNAAGAAPEIIEEHSAADGSGTLLVTISSVAQGSTHPIRMTLYARTTITPKGVLVAVALVPAEQYPAEAALITQMVDSLRVFDLDTPIRNS